MKVGFIGLGLLGQPMARRLARCGHEVTGCDASSEARAAFDEPGTRVTAEPRAAAGGAEVVGLCVRTDAQAAALLADGTLVAAMAPAGIVAIHATIAPDLARSLADTVRAAGRELIDVGVSPGGPAALEGRMALFVGGADGAVGRAAPYLAALGTTHHLGPVGRGLEAKLLNNFASVASYGVAASVLDYGIALGFDMEALRAALLGASARSFALEVVPGLAGLRPDTGVAHLEAMHDLFTKDVGHARALPAEAPAARRTLAAASEALLARIRRAIAERRG
ncbi:MAG: NAD(P)-dependent oxidoreductase [Sphingomonadales bacterium]|nr:NAD(P)-dependent oxidoreductase [Sphingomonadales bacterium]